MRKVLLALTAKFCDTRAMSKPLDIEVRELLEQRRGTWASVARECEISHSWISQFVRGKIPNPGFVTLSRLQAYLSAQAVAAPVVEPEKAPA
jgi:transcriptional regulator with XRE-family HTH domain